MLGIPYPAASSFSPLSPVVAEMTRLATQSDAVLLSAVPFGPANVSVLEAAMAAQQAGRPVICLQPSETPFAARDFTGGKRFASGKTSWRQEPRLSPTMTQPSPLSVGFARDRTHSANARHGPCQLAPLLVS